MKRYERAKKEGLNWQAVLVQDLETDVKIYMLNAVRRGESYPTANQTVSKLINERLNELESSAIRSMAYSSLTKYASRVYMQALSIYGNKEDAIYLLYMFEKSGVEIPDKVKASISSLPSKNVLQRQISSVNSGDLAYNRAVANDIYSKEYEKTVIERTNQLLDGVAKVDYSEYSSLRASVERQIRWEYHEKQFDKLRNSGENLVWIDSHVNCSGRCEPWQGKLYSLDHTAGKIDGISYQPIGNATDIYYTTKTGKTYKNGCLSGFNCRHKTVVYSKGFRPQAIPESVTKKQYAIDKRMRELEREVRKYEVRALGYKGENKEMYKASVVLRNAWIKKYEDFARKNNVATYPSRIDV